MTIVIGKLQLLTRPEGEALFTEDALVMAADTEETAADFKRSVSKLEQFKHRNGSLVIGGAGPAPQIETITQTLQDDFQSWDGKELQELEQAFRETIKEHYREQVLSWPMPEREDNHFSLLIGLALPSLDRLRLLISQNGMLRGTKTAAIGTGANYAYDLLKEHLSFIGGPVSVSALIAVYIIYKVKRNIPYCGMDTQVWQIANRGRWIPPDLIEKAEGIFKRFDDFLSGQLFVAVRGASEKIYDAGFDTDNLLQIFGDLRDELIELVAEMEKHPF